MMREFFERVRFWFTPGKQCRHCCVVCPYYQYCKYDKPNGGVPIVAIFGKRRVATIWFKEVTCNA